MEKLKKSINISRDIREREFEVFPVLKIQPFLEKAAF